MNKYSGLTIQRLSLEVEKKKLFILHIISFLIEYKHNVLFLILKAIWFLVKQALKTYNINSEIVFRSLGKKIVHCAHNFIFDRI